MKICLLRHGETDWNNLGKFQGREDIPLNSTGVEQIKEVAKYLKRFKWKAIITSPLLRAKKSAEIISTEIKNIEIHEDADFIERDYGKVSGMKYEERNLYLSDESMESFEAMQNRTLGALLKYIKQYEGNDIIIVSHGAAIYSILTCFTENETGMGKTVSKNACMTLLEKNGDKIKIVFFNKTAAELADKPQLNA